MRTRHLFCYCKINLFAALVLLLAAPVMADDSASTVKAVVSNGPPLPISTAGHIGGMVKGIPVVAGGSHWADHNTKRWLHECFVFEGKEWKEGPSLPGPLADAAYASDQQGLYVAGGAVGKDQPTDQVIYLKDASSSGHWESLPKLPASRTAASGAVIQRQFYVFGGFTDGKASTALLVLNLDHPEDGWRALAPLSGEGRGYVALAAMNEKLIVLGGFAFPPPQAQIFSDGFAYDTKSDRWTKLEGVDLKGYAWTAAPMNDHQLLLTGRVPEIAAVNEDLICFDLKTLRFQVIGKRKGGCCAPIIVRGGNEFFITGGEPDVRHSRSAVTSFVTVEDTTNP